MPSHFNASEKNGCCGTGARQGLCRFHQPPGMVSSRPMMIHPQIPSQRLLSRSTTGTNTPRLDFLNMDPEIDRFIEALLRIALRSYPCGEDRTEGKLTHDAQCMLQPTLQGALQLNGSSDLPQIRKSVRAL